MQYALATINNSINANIELYFPFSLIFFSLLYILHLYTQKQATEIRERLIMTPLITPCATLPLNINPFIWKTRNECKSNERTRAKRKTFIIAFLTYYTSGIANTMNKLLLAAQRYMVLFFPICYCPNAQCLWCNNKRYRGYQIGEISIFSYAVDIAFTNWN